MKKLVLYLMLLIAVPATAQSGLFGSHSHRHSHAPAEHHHHGSLMHHGPGEHSYTVQVMNSEDFDLALRYISNKSFDSDRLEAAKEIVRHNWVSARQIASICRLFTFDSNRLEFAKYAYRYCIDKNKYYAIYEVFDFDSSKQELNEYIQQQ